MIEQEAFCFSEAIPLIRWLDEHRDWFIGHRLERIYMIANWSYHVLSSEWPIFLALDDRCICVDYMVLSELRLLTADQSDFYVSQAEYSLYGEREAEFHSCLPEQDNLVLMWDPLFPAMGQKIVDVRVDRFCEGFEDWEGDMKPDGDYFSALRFVLEDGTVLCIQGEVPIADRYLDVWFENLPVIKYLRPILTQGTLDSILERKEQLWHIVRCVEEDAKNRPDPDELARLMLEVIAYYDRLAVDYLQVHATEAMYSDLTYMDEPLNKLRDLNYILGLYARSFIAAGMNRNYLNESGKTVRECLDGWFGRYIREDRMGFCLRKDWRESRSASN